MLRGRFAKELHVSPFMGMDHVYEARATAPGRSLSVYIESLREGSAVFDATLALQRVPLTNSSAARLTARYPLATARVLALIYGHAVGLKLAGARVHPHPRDGTGRLMRPRSGSARWRHAASVLLDQIRVGSLTVVEDGRAAHLRRRPPGGEDQPPLA